MQPQTETKGIPSAHAICMTPVSPPMANLECFRMCAVSKSVEVPQNEDICGDMPFNLEAISLESCPPTIAILSPESVNLMQTSRSMFSGIALPL